MSDSHLQNLNPAQKEAVEHKEGPLMIIAGAGAGKTRVITHRIVHLIKNGVAPEEILAVTFTNKAAKEMRERVFDLLGSDVDFNRPVNAFASGMSVPFVSTFHALCVHILREHAAKLGLKRHFSIFDRDESKKALREAIKSIGEDPKTFDPGSTLSAISLAKGQCYTPEEYAEENSTNPRKQLIAQAWERYNEILKRESALDFDDLLVRALALLQEDEAVLKKYRARWRYIHIDEYQDTNAVQYELARLLAEPNNNICVVGDHDQCLIKGTRITMADGTEKPIEKIKKDDVVLANYGSGRFAGARVTQTHRAQTRGKLVRITTQSGRVIESTKEHMHFAGYQLGISEQKFFTYLMHKKGSGWRIGVSAVYTKGQKRSVVGFKQRTLHEHADEVWVVAVHDTINEARKLEYILSLKYQIPTVPFVARRGCSVGGYVHDQNSLDEIFAEFNTDDSAKKMLADLDLSIEYPHHRAQASKSYRRNIVVTLCGDKRGSRPMHRISVYGSDIEGRHLLEKAGFQTRNGGHGPQHWRFEIANKDFGVICKAADELKKILPGAHVVRTARLGNMTKTKSESKSLPFLPAASVMPGMVMCDANGDFDIVITKEYTKKKKQTVYDLDIENVHNFIANGIVTHNSIYSWRGADMTNILDFEEAFPGTKTILLEQNYRSTQTILTAANQAIAKNTRRKDKNLFTENNDGERIAVYGASGAEDEARFIVERAQELIERGVSPREIAVLYRANFQSRAIEEAFLYSGTPYQVLGTKFFDRKEVKDILAYIRASLNTDNRVDVARIVATPPRGIGKMTLAKMLEDKDHELSPAAQKKVSEFRALLSRIAEYALARKPSETIKMVLKESGMEELFLKTGDDGLERLENVKELASLATKYDGLPAGEGVERLLEDAALATDQDSLEKNEAAVKLMTIHAAKGLEFDYVFVTGLEEGLFPHERMGEEKEDDEEERRLFYVALTRARKQVFLTHALVRTIFGSQTIQTPSQFIDDIDDTLLEVHESELSQWKEGREDGKIDLIDF